MHSNWITRVRTIHCLYLHFQNLSYSAVLIYLLIIIYALSFVWVAINGSACWTSELLWRQVVWKKKRAHCVDMLIHWKYPLWIWVIYRRHYIGCQIVQSALKRFRIRYLTRRYTHYKWVNWCSSAMLQWKKLFLHLKWSGLAVMDYISLLKTF